VPSTIASGEFHADDVDRAERFRHGVLDLYMEVRGAAESQHWHPHAGGHGVGERHHGAIHSVVADALCTAQLFYAEGDL
jgi:hypothetical protein